MNRTIGIFSFSLLMVIMVMACQDTNRQEVKGSAIDTMKINSKYLNETKTVGIYTPAAYDPSKQYPVVYMENGKLWEENTYKEQVDSLIECKAIKPIIVVYIFQNNSRIGNSNHFYYEAEYSEAISESSAHLSGLSDRYMRFFVEELMRDVESKYSISKDREERVIAGTSNSADFVLSMSFKQNSLFGEFWCYSPSTFTTDRYGMLPSESIYHIAWGLKEQENYASDYHAALVSGIKKRGGVVKDMTFDGRPSPNIWKRKFIESLQSAFAM